MVGRIAFNPQIRGGRACIRGMRIPVSVIVGSSFPGVPSVITVHDFQPLRTLAESPRSPRVAVRNRLLSWVMAWASRADRLIAVSAFTAAEAVRVLDVPAERIRVVHHAVDESFLDRPVEAVVDERRRGWLGTERDATVLLNVGSYVPRKNVEAAIRALALLRRGGTNAFLVQIGGRFGPAQRAAIAEERLEPWVRQEPSATEQALVAAYYSADVVVLPSTYEGFGVPALEAMAAGVPIVTSGAGGLAEVVGDAALVVQPPEPQPLAAAIARLLADAALRRSLIERGLARAHARTWAHLVADTRAVYAELLPNP